MGRYTQKQHSYVKKILQDMNGVLDTGETMMALTDLKRALALASHATMYGTRIEVVAGALNLLAEFTPYGTAWTAKTLAMLTRTNPGTKAPPVSLTTIRKIVRNLTPLDMKKIEAVTAWVIG